MRMLARLTCLIALMGSTSGWCQESEIGAREVEDAKIQRLIRERKEREELLSREPTSLDHGASVNPRLLDVIRDNSFGIRFEERDVYFRMLELAVHTPLVQQERYVAQFRETRRLAHLEYARRHLGVKADDVPKGLERNRLLLSRAMQRQLDEFPTFQDIRHYPDENRGHPVSIHGVLRKLTKFDPGKNDRKIGDAYEGWIYTDDSQGNPTVVVFMDKPEHLQVGGDLAEEVQVTGYFFKMYSYTNQERTGLAPLILAGGLLWHPQQKPYEPERLPLEMYLFITLLALLGGYAFWQSNRREMASQIHPRVEADFSKFPPIEHPIHHGPGDDELRPIEPNDS